MATIKICPQCRRTQTEGTVCAVCITPLLETQLTDIYWGKCTEEQRDKHIAEALGEVTTAEIPGFNISFTREASDILRKFVVAWAKEMRGNLKKAFLKTGKKSGSRRKRTSVKPRRAA